VRKTRILVLIMLLLSVLPCGCYDRREVEDMAYVTVMGIDRGVDDRLRLTLQIVSFKEGGGGSTDMGGDGTGGGGIGGEQAGMVDGTLVVTVDCPSIFVGLNLANNATSRQLNLMHAKAILFSEELAREGLIESYITPLTRYREIRETMNFIIVRGKAEELIKENKFNIGTDSSKSTELILQQDSYTGFFPDANIYRFYNALKSDKQQPVAVLAGVNRLNNLKEPGRGEPESVTGGDFTAGEIPRQGGPQREIFGTAVFAGTKMVGALTGAETRIFRMITGELERAFLETQDPRAPHMAVLLDVQTARRPEVTVHIDGEAPVINVKIQLEGAILSIWSGTNYEKPELKTVLEDAFEEQIKDQMDDLIARAQDEFGSDIFGFGKYAAGHFLTMEEWEAYKWLEKFPQAGISTEVDFVIRRTGMMLKTSPIAGSEGGSQ